MKKRKPPILLGAILLILVGVVLAVNASSLPSTPDTEQTAEKKDSSDRPATKAPDKFVDKTDKGKDKVHQSVLTPEVPTVAKGDAQTTVKKIAALPEGAPLIAAPRSTNLKDSKPGINASGQWYRSESGAGKR